MPPPLPPDWSCPWPCLPHAEQYADITATNRLLVKTPPRSAMVRTSRRSNAREDERNEGSVLLGDRPTRKNLARPQSIGLVDEARGVDELVREYAVGFLAIAVVHDDEAFDFRVLPASDRVAFRRHRRPAARPTPTPCASAVRGNPTATPRSGARRSRPRRRALWYRRLPPARPATVVARLLPAVRHRLREIEAIGGDDQVQPPRLAAAVRDHRHAVPTRQRQDA